MTNDDPLTPQSRRKMIRNLGLGSLAAVALPSARGAETAPAVEPTNSSRFINVTRADATFVREPLVAMDQYDEAAAARNTLRMRAILQRAGPGCTIFFPAGQYYFNGAAPGQTSSIESTQAEQTFLGEGMNSTVIRQKSTTVASTIRIRHDRCSIREMRFASADYSKEYQAEWEASSHAAAIHLDAPGDRWHTDPQILNVNINSTGNTIALGDYYRPFSTGVRVTGPWLNVYVHTMWLREVHNAIYVNQGKRMAGPAKFIDVNAYATPPTHAKTWNIFFKSEGCLMEQVELIHCTYIGSQFIYLDGAPLPPDTQRAPAYDMVIDHNYINTCWLKDDGDPKQSGIYLNLPPLEDGSNYSRDIRFTNNSCTAHAPRRGAFFYVTGNCRGITISENDISSGGADKCLYLRATGQVKQGEGIALRDIKITNNYLRNFSSPITLGGDAEDPSRTGKANQGHDHDPYLHDRVIIAGNQTMNEESVTTIGLTTCYLNRCRKVTVNGNSFVNTAKSVLIARQCEEVTVLGNNLGGLGRETAENGLELISCRMANLSGNTIRGLSRGITIGDSEQVSVSQNVIAETKLGLALQGVTGAVIQGNSLRDCQTGLSLKLIKNAAISANQVHGATVPARMESLEGVSLVGNVFEGTAPASVAGNNKALLIRSNIGLADSP